MISWLVIFIMDLNGNYLSKAEYPVYEEFTTCEERKKDFHATELYKIEMVCVSNAHHLGLAKDEGVDYDYTEPTLEEEFDAEFAHREIYDTGDQEGHDSEGN